MSSNCAWVIHRPNFDPVILLCYQSGGLNIAVLLLSEIVWEKFRQGTGVREPYVIHFPDYTAGEDTALIPKPHFHSKVWPRYNAPGFSFDLYII